MRHGQSEISFVFFENANKNRMNYKVNDGYLIPGTAKSPIVYAIACLVRYSIRAKPYEPARFVSSHMVTLDITYTRSPRGFASCAASDTVPAGCASGKRGLSDTGLPMRGGEQRSLAMGRRFPVARTMPRPGCAPRRDARRPRLNTGEPARRPDDRKPCGQPAAAADRGHRTCQPFRECRPLAGRPDPPWSGRAHPQGRGCLPLPNRPGWRVVPDAAERHGPKIMRRDGVQPPHHRRVQRQPTAAHEAAGQGGACRAGAHPSRPAAHLRVRTGKALERQARDNCAAIGPELSWSMIPARHGSRPM